ncbi:hypothetical protein DdX_17117 [Ditylenchus destructor]|uniref:Uncharacterized protein n=1 Tax=Ditylenchus destructor TaxID=166010 RepID=A0AAD4MP55_9BILA|nr:hypothetical protein DdX_17117 [Ditylenchus destructor]
MIRSSGLRKYGRRMHKWARRKIDPLKKMKSKQKIKVSDNAPPLYSTTDRFKNIAQLRRIRDFYAKLYDFLNDLHLVSDYSNRCCYYLSNLLHWDDSPARSKLKPAGIRKLIFDHFGTGDASSLL